ncbi:hypothetical protein CEG14_02080 [Bordetella genomosp. 1]|uniref:Cysteine-rich CPCC domain-containing protein n=1 Tax=Bordetella genomosp. 1 TaxID=1395607 RepID=A0A261SU96_9BORD|nr:CPCC family cysteine-rich protein [Bordetella genomosp. 1]OZI40572.1 hypothetical protein CEG14_02080 [Bordetella genomosp. 1]
MLMPLTPLTRADCPCCGYPTLDQGADFEICLLCDWEDDGQGETDAAEVRGGPNGDYSLAEARSNFARRLVMYREGHRRPITPAQQQIKRELMAAYDAWRDAPADTRDALAAEALRLERMYRATSRLSLDDD